MPSLKNTFNEHQTSERSAVSHLNQDVLLTHTPRALTEATHAKSMVCGDISCDDRTSNYGVVLCSRGNVTTYFFNHSFS